MTPSQEYDLARMGAIKSYAELEYRLAFLLSTLIGCDAGIAWAIFFRIASTRSRYAIIGDLAKLKEEGVYANAWTKLESWLRPLDTARNHIVHWVESQTPTMIVGEGGFRVWTPTKLRSPAKAFVQGAISPSYGAKELEAFKSRFEEMANVIHLYALTIRGKTPLHDIFRQPLRHRTPTALHQALKLAMREAPPGSWQE